MATGWQPPQRALAHQVFGAVLPAAEAGLADGQTHSVLSALWHEVHAEPHCLPACHRSMLLFCADEKGPPSVGLSSVDTQHSFRCFHLRLCQVIQELL